MTVQDKRNSDFAAMPPVGQPLRIVMVDFHDAVERGGAVQSSLRGEGLTVRCTKHSHPFGATALPCSEAQEKRNMHRGI
jgi:hypothetical protein